MITPTKPTSVSQTWRVVSYALGLWVTAMAAAQMVSFEEFVSALRSYQLAGEGGSIAWAIVLVALEICAVPFLFRLTLSPLARMLSALCAVVLPCVWLGLTFMALMNGRDVVNVGYFGGFLEMQLGMLTLTLAAVWSAVVGFSFGPLGGQTALQTKQRR